MSKNKDIIIGKDYYGCVTYGWTYFITHEKPNGETYNKIVSEFEYWNAEMTPTELLSAWKEPVKILGITINYKSKGEIKRLCDGKVYTDSIPWEDYKNYLKNNE